MITKVVFAKLVDIHPEDAAYVLQDELIGKFGYFNIEHKQYIPGWIATEYDRPITSDSIDFRAIGFLAIKLEIFAESIPHEMTEEEWEYVLNHEDELAPENCDEFNYH